MPAHRQRPALVLAVLASLLLSACARRNDDDDDDERDDDSQQEDATPAIPLDELHVIGFGDSVTTGYCSSPGKSYFELLLDNDDDAYPAFAGRDLRSRFAAVTDNNKALDGATSCDFSDGGIRAVLQADPDTSKPTVLLVTLGGNDLIHDYGCGNPHECAAYCADLEDATVWAQGFKERMLGFFRAADEEIDGELFVFIGTIYDPTDGIGDIENASIPLPPWPDGLEVLELYNRTIADIASQVGATLVDVHAAMLGHGLHYNDESHPRYDATDPSYWYCANLEDPNDKGYAAIREAFWTSVAVRLNLE
jgi:lysophospholipase L1-like esterase